jgi:hypothetical protein
MTKIKLGDVFGTRVVVGIDYGVRAGGLRVLVECPRLHHKWLTPSNLRAHPGCSKCPEQSQHAKKMRSGLSGSMRKHIES